MSQRQTFLDSLTHKMAAKASWHQHCVTVTLGYVYSFTTRQPSKHLRPDCISLSGNAAGRQFPLQGGYSALTGQ